MSYSRADESNTDTHDKSNADIIQLCICKWLLLLTWIINHMSGKVWDEITYPFLNFNGVPLKFRNG